MKEIHIYRRIMHDFVLFRVLKPRKKKRWGKGAIPSAAWAPQLKKYVSTLSCHCVAMAAALRGEGKHGRCAPARISCSAK